MNVFFAWLYSLAAVANLTIYVLSWFSGESAKHTDELIITLLCILIADTHWDKVGRRKP